MAFLFVVFMDYGGQLLVPLPPLGLTQCQGLTLCLMRITSVRTHLGLEASPRRDLEL